MQRARKNAKVIAVLASAAAASLLTSTTATAQVDYTLNSFTGVQEWTNAGAWSPAGGPPNSSLDTANVSGDVTGGTLNVNINSAVLPTVTTAGLTLGDTGGTLFSTDVGNGNAGGGAIVFENVNTDPTTGGGLNAFINSAGAAGATNIISAPVHLQEALEITGSSTNDITFSGPIFATAFGRRIENLAEDRMVHITGDVNLFAPTGGAPTSSGGLELRGPGNFNISGSFVNGDGVNTGATGIVLFGRNGGSDTFRPTITLTGDSSNFNREMQVGRALVILGHDLAAGVGQIRPNNGSGNYMAEIHSDNDARNIQAVLGISRDLTIGGEHSITFASGMLGRNGDALSNLLPAGKTLTINENDVGGDYIFLWNANETRTTPAFFDGTGTTILNGRIKNNDDEDTAPNPLLKRGTGTLVVNSTANTYSGPTNIEGGLLLFGPSTSSTVNAFSSTSAINPQYGGAVALVQGSADAAYTEFLNKLDPAAVGAVALSASDAGLNLDFTSGPLAGKGVSVGAQSNLTYTGTITPDSTKGYRLGGGPGALTIAAANQLTGANGVTIDNGGTVKVTASQDYTGSTTLVGANIATEQLRAAAAAINTSAAPGQIFLPSVLEIGTLANGGVASTLGASNSAAGNLVFNGGTLRYVGGAASTDRLFTVGPNGGMIDSSGSGAVTFANTGSAVIDESAGVANRTFTVGGSNTGDNTLAASIGNGTGGSAVGVSKTGAGKWILSAANTYAGPTSVSDGTLVFNNSQTTTSAIDVTGGTLQLTPNQTHVLKTPSLDISGAGRVDLTDNKLITDTPAGTATGTVYDGVQGMVQSAYNFTNWDQPGLMTSMPAAKQGLTTIGISTGKQIRGLGETDTALWGGETITATSTLAMYTYAGDANLDGQIDAGDYGIIDNFVQIDGASGYGNGDFNYDGFIDAGDYGIIDNNIQAQTTAFPTSGAAASAASAGLSGVTAVPEPASLSVIGLAAASLLGRRRRQQ